MLYFTLRYLYFFFLIFLFFLLWFQSQINGDLKNYIFISYILIGIPIFDVLIEFLKKEITTEQQRKSFLDIIQNIIAFGKKVFVFFRPFKSWISFLIISILLYLIWGGNILHFLFLFFIFVSLYFQLDSRISFFWALLLLFTVPLFLLLWDQVRAETVSIYVYYLLVIGVILSIIEPHYSYISDKIRHFFTLSKTFLQDNFSWLFSSYDDIVYDSFFLFFLLFLLSIYYPSAYQLLPWFFVFFLVIYIFGKILWFSFENHYEKIHFFSREYYHHYVLFISINIIVYSQMLSHMEWGWNIYYLVWISFWIFLLFMTIFSDIWERVKKTILTNLYLSLMMLVILWVSGVYFLSSYFTPNVPWELSQIEEESVEWTPSLSLSEPLLQDDLIPQIKEFNLSQFSENLKLGSEWEGVKILQSFLNEAGYYNFEFHGRYDDKTQIAMRRFLTNECDWSETNQWILWPQARACIQDFLEKK